MKFYQRTPRAGLSLIASSITFRVQATRIPDSLRLVCILLPLADNSASRSTIPGFLSTLSSSSPRLVRIHHYSRDCTIKLNLDAVITRCELHQQVISQYIACSPQQTNAIGFSETADGLLLLGPITCRRAPGDQTPVLGLPGAQSAVPELPGAQSAVPELPGTQSAVPGATTEPRPKFGSIHQNNDNSRVQFYLIQQVKQFTSPGRCSISLRPLGPLFLVPGLLGSLVTDSGPPELLAPVLGLWTPAPPPRGPRLLCSLLPGSPGPYPRSPGSSGPLSLVPGLPGSLSFVSGPPGSWLLSSGSGSLSLVPGLPGIPFPVPRLPGNLSSAPVLPGTLFLVPGLPGTLSPVLGPLCFLYPVLGLSGLLDYGL